MSVDVFVIYIKNMYSEFMKIKYLESSTSGPQSNSTLPRFMIIPFDVIGNTQCSIVVCEKHGLIF